VPRPCNPCSGRPTDIPPWLSNALCKGVTGDAVLQRVLHSDEDIGVYSFQRVIALTTIAIDHEPWPDSSRLSTWASMTTVGRGITTNPACAVYGHVSLAMRAELKAALQARWEESLRQRAALSLVSAVPLLNRLLADIRPASKPARSHLTPKIGHRGRRNANRRSPDAV